MTNRPSVVFCNLQNSGSSAIDPVLRELFARSGYSLTKYGPEGTHRLREELERGQITAPFYHWTHDPVETFAGLIGNPAFRFIFMHRDPRDAAVSWAHDFQRSGAFGDMPLPQILETVVEHIQPPHVRAATQWINSECLTITFQQVVQDVATVIHDILKYVGYFDWGLACLPDIEIQKTINKFSFEAMTGRKRGEEGEVIRTGYMIRKGVTGEWKNFFSPSLLRKCHEAMGKEIQMLGYPITDHINNW